MRHVLDDCAHLRALRGARRAQDGRHRRTTRHMIDVHRRKAALVMMRVPERQLLAAMRRAEGVINVEDFRLPRPNGRAELIDKGSAQPCSFHLARRVLQTRDGRLRSERIRALGAPLDGDLHQRIVPEPIEVVGVLIPTGDSGRARHHKLDHLVLDARWIAAIRHGLGKPPTYAELPLRLPKQKEAGIGGLISTIKINCEFLATDGW